MKHKKIRNTLLGIVPALAIFLSFAGIAVNRMTYPPGAEAAAALEDSRQVKVSDRGTVAFEPEERKNSTGVILYPGALVSPEAYAPLALEIAEQGYPVFIVRMPMNLAVLAPQQGSKILALHPEIDNWVVGGHSLGGAMAPEFAEQEDSVKGVYFLAAYPAGGDLRDAGTQVASFWGSDDGVADLDKVKSAAEFYPEDAVMREIEGGNHAGFGDYGFQKGDNPAEITNTEQMHKAAEGILSLLEKIQ